MSGAVTNRVLLAVALALAAVYLFPLYWMYVTSLKTQSSIFAVPPEFLPGAPQWDNYATIWEVANIPRYIGNSLVIASGVTLITALIGSGCAYVLARYRNGWIDAALFAVLMLQVLPPSLMVTPIFVGFASVGLLEYPRFATILAFSAKTMPFFVILCRAAFMTVPRELEEAALVDGNSRVGAFFMIVLPLARNGLLISALLVFMNGFGEYVYSASIIADNRLQPASIGMTNFLQPNVVNWNAIMAFAATYVTPILAAFVLLQRQIVNGLTAGALK
ncbi:carbohydrate ABC transporter permease [Rhodophyticola porphyridii]|uniref:Carbohydrate ABC transporter permease n=1 Tax=Rhodophyticola porphyridii TaxID=1852017 RepID=A0A3L9Y1I4_9RHOB|nr:carbohydrate ABC transporter permease [Rhodophyticola porphyridii]RMA42322.1 carbohydrate ABC transporter permease [Rhodophyticola porphyridii]